jgi:formate hydrogenlyase subunit 3/multisubunit Na+/H+ antiporter MnhD subunit
MGAFWNPREGGAVDAPGARLERGPILMVAPTAFLVACTLAIAVAAGPIYSVSERAAADLLDRGSYISAVLDR